MKKYEVWLESGVAGHRFSDIIEIPKDATEEEIEVTCKDVAFSQIDWGYYLVEELEE